MSNPNLFKLQKNPDGKKGHKEREKLRNMIKNQDEKLKENTGGN